MTIINEIQLLVDNYNDNLLEDEEKITLSEMCEIECIPMWKREEIESVTVGSVITTTAFPAGFTAEVVKLTCCREDQYGLLFVHGYQQHGDGCSKVSFSVKEGDAKTIKQPGKPVYYKYTHAISGGAWIYDADGTAIRWLPWSKIKKMELEERTPTW